MFPENWFFRGCIESITEKNDSPQWEWFHKNFNKNYGFTEERVYYSDGAWDYDHKIRKGFKEITFQEFLDNIIHKPDEPKIQENYDYLIPFIKRINNEYSKL